MAKHATHIHLNRGGVVIHSSEGAIQFGAPPETIKDTMQLDCGVPGIFLACKKLFYLDTGVSICELEFPVYYNVFILGRPIKVVCSSGQKRRLKAILQEAVFGPRVIDVSREFVRGRRNFRYPDLAKEMEWFARHPRDKSRSLEMSDCVSFSTFDKEDMARIGKVEIHSVPEGFTIRDGGEEIITLSANISLPAAKIDRPKAAIAFKPPLFGTTIIGAGSGFQASDTTTGFILWINRKGILVDPPINTTQWLRAREINPRLIEEIILTHCHADHDAGTVQKLLEAGRISVYSTRTVMDSFIRKTRALTSLSRDRLYSVFNFIPVLVNEPVRIAGAEFHFHYTLHPIPTVGFEVFFQGKSLVYSSDTLNEPEIVEQLFEKGILNEGRRDQLQNFPWHHTLVLHEAGIPPVHTSIERLAALPDDVKERLWVLHFDGDKIPSDSGLAVATPGLADTMAVQVASSPFSKAIELLNVYANVDLFKDFPPMKAAEFLNICQLRRVRATERLWKAGEQAAFFYIVLSGQVAFIRGGKEAKVCGYNDYFGESALVSELPGSADVIAKTDVELLCIDKYDLLYFLRGTDVMTILRNLYVNRQLRSWMVLEVSKTFRNLSAAQKTRLQTLLVTARMEPGEWLFQEGTRATHCYIIASGKAEVLKGDKRIAVLRRGDFAGHIIPFRKRWKLECSIRVLETCELFVLDLKDFIAYLEDNPGFYLRLSNLDYATFT